MNSKSRVVSVLEAESLDFSVTGFQTFQLSDLEIEAIPEFQLLANVRLGHLVEQIISELIKVSPNFDMIDQNIQITEENRTIGELDFIIRKVDTQQLIHMELAYKFYLFDPGISAEPINSWIGPNRNDSLKEKLEKLKQKQFPLLFHPFVKPKLPGIQLDEVSQSLCLLASLYVPYEHRLDLNPAFAKAIKGYYSDLNTFTRLNDSSKSYYLPPKKEWGMDPAENQIWSEFKEVEKLLLESLSERQGRLCWQKQGEMFTEFFVVWW